MVMNHESWALAKMRRAVDTSYHREIMLAGCIASFVKFLFWNILY